MKIIIDTTKPKENNWDIYLSPIDDLNTLSNHSVSEIYAPNLLNYIDKQYLNILLTKMRLGCKIIIGGTNITELSRLYTLGLLNSDQLNACLFYPNNSYKIQRFWTPTEIKNLFKEMQLSNIYQKNSQVHFIVSAQRDN